MGYTVSIASAGSGKTTSMVGNIIEALLKADERGLEDEINGSMAITFTNKAASEMKQKILDTLHRIALNDIPAPYRALVESMGGAALVAPKAAHALLVILHNYHLFHIHTIDSFIQRIARTIAYELELPVNYEITLDKNMVITKACKSLIGKIGTESRDSTELDALFNAYMDYLLTEKFSWKLEEDFTATARELLGEQFYNTIAELENTDGFTLDISFIKKIHAQFFALKNTIISEAKNLLALVDSFLKTHAIDAERFAYKGAGSYSLVKKIATGDLTILVKRGSRIFDSWFKKADQSGTLASDFDRDCLPALEDFTENTFVVEGKAPTTGNRGSAYLAYEIFLRTLPTLCLMKFIDKETAAYIRNEGVVLLDEFTKRLKEKISLADIPYIFMRLDAQALRMFIDEFQDTSRLQWLALEQFKDNLAASGKDFFIIGDPKQAIYRWRNGDVRIMLDEIQGVTEGAYQDGMLKFLDTNYRSSSAVVEWNNHFFSLLLDTFGKKANTHDEVAVNSVKKRAELDTDDSASLIGRILASYASHEQILGSNSKQAGYVRVELVSPASGTGSRGESTETTDEEAPNSETEENSEAYQEDGTTTTIPSFALERCLEIIKENLDRGYSKKDMVMLIRNNKEAEDLATVLLANGIDFVSENSFTVLSSPAVRCLVLLLGLLLDGNDNFRLQLALDLYAHYFAPDFDYDNFLKASREAGSGFNLATRCGTCSWYAPFSEFFVRQAELRSLTLYNMAETLIRIFAFNTFPEQSIFLQFFLDQVQLFTVNSGESLRDFVAYMEDPKNSASIALSDDLDAVRIMTIHKSKGLEFPVVMLPNANWKIQNSSYIEAEVPRFIWEASTGNQPQYIYKTNKNMRHIAELAPKLDEEEINALLDNINLLYVAMTRAKNILHVVIPSAKKKNTADILSASLLDSKTIGDLILASLGSELLSGTANSDSSAFDHASAISDSNNASPSATTTPSSADTQVLYEAGDSSERAEIEETERVSQAEADREDASAVKGPHESTTTRYPFITQPGRVYTAANLEDIRIALDSGRTAQVDYGTLVHRFFAGLRSAADIDNIFSDPSFALLSDADKKDIETKAKRIWDQYERSGWLNLQHRYFEAGILSPGGEKRPDCVFAGGDRAVIVDYKTGTQADTDKPELLSARFARQLGEYAELYRALGYTTVETWIAAPDRGELIQVRVGADL